MTIADYEKCVFLRNSAFFEGHLTITAVFIVCSLWWLYNILRGYHESRISAGRSKFQSQLWYVGPFTRHLPLECVFKLLVFGFQILFYTLMCPILHLPCTYGIHGQHSQMFLMFSVTSITELMLFFKIPLPEGTDRAVNALSFLVTGFLFYFHGGHLSNLNDAMHLHVLPWLCVAIACALVWEAYDPSSVVVAMVRPFLLAVFSTWFCQLGFTLYPIFSWQTNVMDGDNVGNVRNVPMLFSFHVVGVVFMFLVANLWVVSRQRRVLPQYKIKDEQCYKCEAHTRLLDTCKIHLSE